MACDITVTLDSTPSLVELEGEWRRLEQKCQPSFFVSWSWIGTWLGILPEPLRPLLMRIEEGGETIGLALFVRNSVTRRGFLGSTGMYLNETGDPALDKLFIEHNGFLASEVHRGRVIAAALDYFWNRCREWEEIFFGGITQPDPYLDWDADHERMSVRIRSTCHFVDLDRIRREKKEYLSFLSSNTRAQIRRAVKEYEKHGRVGITPASSPNQAVEYLSGLRELHQAYWQSRGQPGSFSTPCFVRFHENLVHRCFDKGEIQMLRIHAGQRTIGYLYNFVSNGRVYNYQSGFDYACLEQHNRPGMVAHALAIQYNLDRGAGIYDLLAGDNQYKRSLGTDSFPMTWLVLQRSKLKFRLERWLLQAKRHAVALTASVRNRHATQP